MVFTFAARQSLLVSCSVPKPFVAVILHHFDQKAVAPPVASVSLVSFARRSQHSLVWMERGWFLDIHTTLRQFATQKEKNNRLKVQ